MRVKKISGLLRKNRFFITSSEVGPISPFKLTAAFLFGLPLIPYAFFLNHKIRFRLLGANEHFEGPTIIYSWHQNTFLTLLLARHADSCRNAIGLTNDRLASLLVTLPATVFGYRMFIFTLKNKRNRVQQVSECFQFGNPLIMMADGGGPFFKIKPGLIKTAIESKAKLVPVAFRLKHGLELGKIRKHRWPLLFSEVDCLIGKAVECDLSQTESSFAICQRALDSIEAELNAKVSPAR